MNEKIAIFEEILEQKDTYSLVSLRDKILKENPSLIDKNTSHTFDFNHELDEKKG